MKCQQRSTALPEKFGTWLPTTTPENICAAASSEVHCSFTVRSLFKLSNKIHLTATIVTGGRFISLEPRRLAADLSEDLA
jgi:hypothetical protein